jgi:hypothetical protein
LQVAFLDQESRPDQTKQFILADDAVAPLDQGQQQVECACAQPRRLAVDQQPAQRWIDRASGRSGFRRAWGPRRACWFGERPAYRAGCGFRTIKTAAKELKLPSGRRCVHRRFFDELAAEKTSMERPYKRQAPLSRIVFFAAALVATVSLAAFIDSLATGYSKAAQATAQAQPVVVARRCDAGALAARGAPATAALQAGCAAASGRPSCARTARTMAAGAGA